MGCRNCAPIRAERRVEDSFEYQETLVSKGGNMVVDFKKKNRRVVRAWTFDKDITFCWTEDRVQINGPPGQEVMVKFTIGR
jgi:hypothetical protein